MSISQILNQLWDISHNLVIQKNMFSMFDISTDIYFNQQLKLLRTKKVIRHKSLVAFINYILKINFEHKFSTANNNSIYINGTEENHRSTSILR